MRDVHLRFSIDRSTCQRSHLSLVFCECLQVIIHKGNTGLAYKISPMYRGSQVNKGALFRAFGDASFAGLLREGPGVMGWNIRLS